MNNILGTILRTKIKMPGLNPYIVKRKRIIEELDKALLCKLTVVTGSAGYGKTTSVLDWLGTLPIPAAWVSLDSGDNSPVVFWQYILAAFHEAIEEISLPDSIIQTKEYFESKIFLTILINRLSEIKSNIILVLDDFHLIHKSVIHEYLAYFINFLPDNVHILIITRTLSGDVFKNIRFFEKMMIISSKTLRFTKDEIYLFYKSRGLELKKEEADRIEECTEGWAIALMAEHSNNTIYRESYKLISAYKGYDVLLEGYIYEDYITTWTPQQQLFMLKTSILNRFCNSLCDAVTDSDTKDMLIYLYQYNSFLSQADGDGLWFRYHNHYSDFLYKELAEKYPSEIPGLHRRAGNWYEEAGYLTEAVTHYMKGAYYEGITNLIHTNSDSIIKRGEYLLLGTWVDSLPENIIWKDYDLLVIKTISCICNNEFSHSEEYLKRMNEIIRKESGSGENGIQKTKLLLIKAYLKVRAGSKEDCREAAGLLDEIVNIKMRDTSYKIDSELNTYDISSYRDLIGGTPKILHMNKDLYENMMCNYLIATNANIGYDFLVRGEYYYETNRLQDALEMLKEAEHMSGNEDCPGVLMPVIALKAKIKRVWGNTRDALEILDSYQVRVLDFRKPHWHYMFQALRAQLLLNMGRVEEAWLWAESSKLNVYQEVTRIREYELLVYARVLIGKKYYDKAVILLNSLLGFAMNNSRRHSMVEILNLLAITFSKTMNEERVCTYIERALSIGLKEGYIRSFLDEFNAMRTVLNIYIHNSKGNGRLVSYVKKLLKQLTAEGTEFQLKAESPIDLSILTPAEHRILHYVAEGWNNEDIAEELNITVRTVKAHTGSIYKKLDVRSRVECIIKVKKLFR